MRLTDQGHHSREATMALFFFFFFFNGTLQTDVKHETVGTISLNCICVQHDEGEIPGSFIHSAGMCRWACYHTPNTNT